MTRDTAREEESVARGGRGALPGVVVVFTGGAPTLRPIPLVAGRVVLGRADAGDDPLVSRAHVEIRCHDGVWAIRDLGSRNGTYVDGEPVATPHVGAAPRVIRIGATLLLPRADVSRTRGADVLDAGDLVAGPALRAAIELVEDAARRSDSLLIEGESGTGKELLAGRFRAARAAAGAPFVAVNCSAIPAGMAERLFLGSRRGAYSGAVSDAAGYFEAADGGVLFLDEIGELELPLQAKLLRVLETREVMPLGATTARRVRFGVCFATHRDLATCVAEDRFRADLYYRIAQPRVSIPPLRERPEEIPFLVMRQVASAGGGLPVHVKVVEACLLRPWPGNVRELLAEMREAVARARRAGADQLGVAHLGPRAGRSLGTAEVAGADAPRVTPSRPPGIHPDAGTPRERLVAALEEHDHNVRATAAALGMHRTQLYRAMRRLGIELGRHVRVSQD